ncbi:MAG: hypothetical protein V4529_17065 [Gemmatimonadota bacterium]
MAAAVQHFEVVNPPEGSSITLKHFIRCEGGVVPTWVEDCAKRYDGKIPPDRPVFVVDVPAEMAERAAMVPEVVDLTRFTNAETMAYLHWSESDYVTARDLFDFPKNDAFREDFGVWIGGGAGEPCRLKSAIDTWLVNSRDKIAVLSRLIASAKR